MGRLGTVTVLLVIVVGFVLGGAWLFIHVEYDAFESRLNDRVAAGRRLETQRRRLANQLWVYRQQPDYNALAEWLVEAYHGNVTDAIKRHGYRGKVVDRAELSNSWSLPSALLFTFSVVTTIGYGHVHPTTDMGKALLVCYAVVGIPLMVVVIANIGDGMATFFKNAYRNGCCRVCNRRRDEQITAYLRRQELQRIGAGGKEDDEGQQQPDWLDLDQPHDTKTSLETMRVEDVDLDDDGFSSEQVPMTLVLTIIVGYMLIGVLLLSFWNEWSGIKAAYFCFITLSTLGFGDLIPGWENMHTVQGQLNMMISNVYIVTGLAVLSMAFNLMTEELILKIQWAGEKLNLVGNDEEIVKPEPEDSVPERDVKDEQAVNAAIE